MSNSRESMGVNGEALQLHSVYKKPYFVLQVMQESVSGTTSHVRFFWTCNEIKGSYDKLVITIVCALVTIQTATMVNYCGTLCCLGCCTTEWSW